MTVWDSKKVNSGQAHAIQYEGKAFAASTKYTWTVQVWDNKGKVSKATSWFETGLMNTSESAWSGAQWIGGGDEDLVFYPHYLSVFKLSFGIQLDKGSASTKGSVIFGANDTRLANKYLNLMVVERGKNESYAEIELDISGLTAENGKSKLNIYRIGYTNDDKEEVPLKSLEIPDKLINNANKYEKHRIIAESNFGIFEFYIDGNDAAHKVEIPMPDEYSPFAPRGLNLNPVGSGNISSVFRWWLISGFKTREGQATTFSDLKVSNFRFPPIHFSKTKMPGCSQE
ncbi:MAG: hypothetical protein IPO04_10830 [Cytophagaceae bacterium]|nr:hypothetical protein [Cytophagaceae bacterium]